MGMMMMVLESVVVAEPAMGCGAIEEEPTSDLAAEKPPQEQSEQAASSAPATETEAQLASRSAAKLQGQAEPQWRATGSSSKTVDPPVRPAAPEPAVEQVSRGYSSDDELNRRRRTALNASVRILPLPVRNTGGGPAAAAAAAAAGGAAGAAAGAGQGGIESGAPGSGKEEWQLALLALPEVEADVGQTGGSNGSSAPASQQQLADGQSLCTFYVRTGTCAYGERCKFVHPAHCPPPKLNSRGYPLRAEEPPCMHYSKKGWCAFGLTCKYHHPEIIAKEGSLVLGMPRRRMGLPLPNTKNQPMGLQQPQRLGQVQGQAQAQLRRPQRLDLQQQGHAQQHQIYRQHVVAQQQQAQLVQHLPLLQQQTFWVSDPDEFYPQLPTNMPRGQPPPTLLQPMMLPYAAAAPPQTQQQAQGQQQLQAGMYSQLPGSGGPSGMTPGMVPSYGSFPRPQWGCSASEPSSAQPQLVYFTPMPSSGNLEGGGSRFGAGQGGDLGGVGVEGMGGVLGGDGRGFVELAQDEEGLDLTQAMAQFRLQQQ